ncbi:hypothetical protein [Streptomyces sp. NBC_01304]|uniref:hypothetical protein n=1 Tax=Streptomyces sp. NBC_01304 TaxID=2903818 RepID=UPI002E139AE8|nr:hypothetical protein OG430_47670 [Streptomyces sp. NBC_01304]
MSRKAIVILPVFLSVAALTSCSSSSSDGAEKEETASKPITKKLAQAELTQALPGAGEVLEGWEPYKEKRVTDEGADCTKSESDSSPKGWMRGSSAWFIYDGTTENMLDIGICLYDSAETSKRAYAVWKGTESSKEKNFKEKVGDEAVLVVNPGASERTLYGFTRSGNINIKVQVDGAGADEAGVQTILETTLKRLQQVQDGDKATATAAEQTKNS